MNMRWLVTLSVVAVIGILTLPVFAQPSTIPGPGYMGPGWQTTGQPLSIAQAEAIARNVLDRSGYDGLELDEIQEFSNNFYVAVKYKTGGQGAFEFLIDRYTGGVHPEPSSMMWNTQFGCMAGRGGAGTGLGGMMGPGFSGGIMSPGSGATGTGMMGPGMVGPGFGPMGPGMMGGGYGYGPGGSGRFGAGPGFAPTTKPQVTAAQAKTIAQTFLDTRVPGTKVRNVDTFPGYYTLDITRDGKVAGMLSVNAYTGQVWYHAWHGTFVQEKESH